MSRRNRIAVKRRTQAHKKAAARRTPAPKASVARDQLESPDRGATASQSSTWSCSTLAPESGATVLESSTKPCKTSNADAFSSRIDEPVISSAPVIDKPHPKPSPTNAPADPRFAPMKPFPVNCFPRPVRDYVVAQAKSLDCDPASIALPLLSVLASSIGAARQIRLKQGWSEPATLWTALVAGSETQSALTAATAPLNQFQRLAYRNISDSNDREPDAAQSIHQYVARHWHLPTLLKTAAHQPRGLLLCANDLEGWIGRSSRIGARRSVDLATWHDLHAGRPVVVTIGRKQPPIPVTDKSLCVTGILAPAILIEKLSKSPVPCSLLSRTLIAMPPVHPRRWTDDDVEPHVASGYTSVVGNLLALASDPSPDVDLSNEAQNCFATFLNDFGTSPEQDESLSPWLANLPAHAARLALVIHLTRWSAGEKVNPDECDLTSMRQALELADWFATEAARVLSQLTLCAENLEQQLLLEWIQRRGGVLSARDLNRVKRRHYPTADLAQQALEELVTAGFGRWIHLPPGEKGGPPHQQFALGLPTPDQPADEQVPNDTDQPANDDQQFVSASATEFVATSRQSVGESHRLTSGSA